MHDFGSIRCHGRRCLCERRLAAPRLGSGANPDTDTDADSYAAPAPSGGCTTPNPFASMGTGTCVNGGWQFGSPAPAPSTGSRAGSNAGTGAGANRRMHNTKSVRVDGHRHLRERRVDFCRTAFRRLLDA
jgi:hypothetical protein